MNEGRNEEGSKKYAQEKYNKEMRREERAKGKEKGMEGIRNKRKERREARL